MNAIDDFDIPNKKINVALIDGHYRVACALKLLHYDVDFVLMHDFGLDVKPGWNLSPILSSYDWVDTQSKRDYFEGIWGGFVDPLDVRHEKISRIIGSMAVFRKKEILPENWRDAWKLFLRL